MSRYQSAHSAVANSTDVYWRCPHPNDEPAQVRREFQRGAAPQGHVEGVEGVEGVEEALGLFWLLAVQRWAFLAVGFSHT
ncbi:hypothetical protein ACFVXA_09055 [Streptomyces sp. NPDC058246]|uniref:hypothetical protein n=1 Tax=Streptomyces sp. NPDC058246 TaxID=3346400 RepID=UPI0036E4857E